MKKVNLMLGDNIESLKKLPDNSIDSVVTDPPYGLSFMGKKWDYDVPSVEFWKEVYRVLKPGGHVLSFGGTRTYHRMVVNIEDAGFEIRDQIMWLYSTGFPKSLNIQKQFDKNGYKVCECSKQNTQYDMRQVPETDISQTINTQSEQGQTLLKDLYEPNIQGTLSSDIKRTEQEERTNRGEKSSVEGWSNTIQKEGELQRNNIQESAGTTKTDGEKGWLHNGTQVDNGSISKPTIDEDGSSPSHRPQPEQQSSKQSGIMADKRRPQESGSRKICGRCGEQVVNVKGFGTSLKPANEPICVARKPLSEKTVAENVLKWGTGGINVDGSRVGSDLISSGKSKVVGGGQLNNENTRVDIEETFSEGRFPANIILECLCDEVIRGEKGEIKSTNRVRKGEAAGGLDISENKKSIEGIDNYNDKGDIHTNPMCPCRLLDEQSGVSKSSRYIAKNTGYVSGSFTDDNKRGFEYDVDGGFTDKGGASRFFYQAKVSKAERNMGLDGFEETTTGGKGHGLDRRCSHCNTSMLKPEDCKCEEPDWITPAKKNTHPCLKPINLMTYLCRLVTPEGGIVLDPFMGSGSTGISAQLEGFRFVGMEMDSEYFKIAEARIDSFEQYKKFINKKNNKII